jgi:hypothetical protein
MEYITRTIYGAALQSATLLGKSPKINPLSTLNTKFGILADTLPGVNEIPIMQYMAIGIGGHTYTVGGNGVPKPEPVQHRSRDASCYKPLPFVLREAGNDLSDIDRRKYALRREETHNGLRYFAYYLRRIDLAGVDVESEYVTVQDEQEVVTPFTPDSSDLNPQPPTLSSTGVNTVTADYLSATAKLTLSLDPTDVSELVNVATVMFNDPDLAIVSEVALCSGVDKQANSPGAGNSPISFLEAIGVQIVSHINAFYPLRFSPNGVNILLDAGATEPLFTIADASAVAA